MLSFLFYFTFSVFAICANAAVPTSSGTRLPKLPALPFPHPNFPKEAPYPPPACLISCVTQNAYPDKCNGMQNYKCLCKTQAKSIVKCLFNICPKDTVFSIKANKNLPISSIAITSFLDTCSSLNFTAPIGPDGKPVSIPKKHSTTSSKLVLDVTTVGKPVFTKPTCVVSHNNTTTTTTTNSTIAWSTAFTNSTSVIATSATFTDIPAILNTTSIPIFPTNISSTLTVGLNSSSSSTTSSRIPTTITRVIVVTRTLPPTKATTTTSNGNQASYTDRSHPVKRQEGNMFKRFYKAIFREELNHDFDKAELLQAIDAYLSEGELVTVELVDKQVSVDTSSLTSEISLEQLTSAFSFNEDISSFSSSVSTTTDNMLSSPLTGSFIATTTIATIDTALSTNIASVSPSPNDMSSTTGNSTLVQSTFTATSTTTLSSSSDTGVQVTSGSGLIISANSTATVTRTTSLTSTTSGMSDTITVTSTSTRTTSSSEPNPDTTIRVTTSVTGSTVTGGTSTATTTTTSGESNGASFLGFDITWLFSVVIIPGFVILM